jgi:hypothetical protein
MMQQEDNQLLKGQLVSIIVDLVQANKENGHITIKFIHLIEVDSTK